MFLFFVKDYFDLDKVSFLSRTSSFCVISNIKVPSGLSDEAAVHPESHWIEASLLSMIKNIPKSSDHNSGNFHFASHKLIDGIQNIESFDWMKGIFAS